MKKLLVGFCAASLLVASAIGYAGTVTFVNDYRQAVNFTASSGYMYNPVAQGTILPGGHFTFQVNGAITPNYNFMAYAPTGSNVVTGCGYIGQTVWDVTVRAGWSNETGRFGCWVYPTPMFMPVKHTCNKHKNQVVVYKNNSGMVSNGQGAVYSNSGGAYNGQGVVYSNSGGAYNGQGVVYRNSGGAYNGQGVMYNGQNTTYNNSGVSESH